MHKGCGICRLYKTEGRTCKGCGICRLYKTEDRTCKGCGICRLFYMDAILLCTHNAT